MIKELAEEFEGEFECLGENTEKYITFSVMSRPLPADCFKWMKDLPKIDEDFIKTMMKIVI